MASSECFTTPVWVRYATAVCAVAFALLGLSLWWWRGWELISLAPFGLSLASLAVCVQACMARVCLQRDGLLVTTRYRSRHYAREQIESLVITGQEAVCLQLRGGKRVYLPEVGGRRGELANVIQAWWQAASKPK